MTLLCHEHTCEVMYVITCILDQVSHTYTSKSLNTQTTQCVWSGSKSKQVNFIITHKSSRRTFFHLHYNHLNLTFVFIFFYFT